MIVLVVNAGSATLKLALVEVDHDAPASAARHVAGFVEVGGATASSVVDGIERLAREAGPRSPAAVAHRVVHGGHRSAPAVVDAAVVADIEAAAELAPLHNRPALEALAAARRCLPDLSHVAVFDTAFFAVLPAVAATYAVPSELAARLGLRRYGFHGLAHRWMAQRLAEVAPRARRVVTLQLGSGCSAAAVVDGHPVDTSMGLTPLEGLVMRTRSGDVDPALPLVVARREGLEISEVERLLSERAGLAGMTGTDGDVRSLLDAEAAGDERAHLALDVFCHRVRSRIGAYAATMGGLDAVVFGGGIGEHQPAVRARCLEGLGFLGIELDAVANAGAVGGEQARISGSVAGEAGAGVEVWTIPVDEAAVAASDTARLLGSVHPE